MKGVRALKISEGFFFWKTPLFLITFILLLAFISAVNVLNFDSSFTDAKVNDNSSLNRGLNSNFQSSTENVVGSNLNNVKNNFDVESLKSDDVSSKNFVNINSEKDQIIEKNGQKYVLRDGEEYLLSSSDYYIRFNPALPSSICENQKMDIKASGVGHFFPDAGEIYDCILYGHIIVSWCVDLMEYDVWPNPDDPVGDDNTVCGTSKSYSDSSGICTHFDFEGTFRSVDLTPSIEEDIGSEGEFYVKIYDSQNKVAKMSSASSDVSIKIPQSHYRYSCLDNDVYWYDTCNNREEKREECGNSGYTGSNYCYDSDVYKDYLNRGCSGSSCFLNAEKIKQNECGVDSCDAWGNNYCKSGNVYHSRTCHDRGCQGMNCFDGTSLEEVKVSDCQFGCLNGECVTVACSSDSDCGNSGWTGTTFCSNNNLYQPWKTYTCNYPGTAQSYCSNSDSNKLKQDCGNSGYGGDNYCYDNDVWRNYVNKGCSSGSCFVNTEGIKQRECGEIGCDLNTNACKPILTCISGTKRCNGNNIEQCK
ncbi:MAG: hypothetical protein WC584_03480, partial [Candidatus Pacearchaeota archaeon]